MVVVSRYRCVEQEAWLQNETACINMYVRVRVLIVEFAYFFYALTKLVKGKRNLSITSFPFPQVELVTEGLLPWSASILS